MHRGGHIQADGGTLVDGATLVGWTVRVTAHEEDGRVVARATMSDDDVTLLVAQGSARLRADSPPECVRSAVNLAASRALRRLSEAALRSAHEGPAALQARL